MDIVLPKFTIVSYSESFVVNLFFSNIIALDLILGI